MNRRNFFQKLAYLSLSLLISVTFFSPSVSGAARLSPEQKACVARCENACRGGNCSSAITGGTNQRRNQTVCISKCKGNANLNFN